jgi:hypothetical protein
MIKKIVSLAMSIAFRGFDNNKIDIPTKQLRVVSCFGNKDNISACHHLKKSKNSDYHFCSGCGCGDKNNTWLLKKDGEYSKLDYPVLNCPLKMPGFTNYDPNYVVKENKDRREKIENMSFEDLKLIQITVNSDPIKEHDINILKNMLKNS